MNWPPDELAVGLKPVVPDAGALLLLSQSVSDVAFTSAASAAAMLVGVSPLIAIYWVM